MISQIVIHPQTDERREKIKKILSQLNLATNHPDVLWLEDEEKLGIEQARKIKEFLSLKPYQGQNQAVVLISSENLTPEAQNALLKTLEEPPKAASIILGLSYEDQLLPTILSRCQIMNLTKAKIAGTDTQDQQEIKKLLSSSREERFRFIEKLENKEDFLKSLTSYFRYEVVGKSAGVRKFHPGGRNAEFLKDLIKAEKWANQNVNIRAILEYLMLRMPSGGD